MHQEKQFCVHILTNNFPICTGKSLVWVAILGLVIFYLYALVAFAYFRDVFVPQRSLYCATLWQCTVTLVRYGLVGDYDEVCLCTSQP